MICNKDMLFTYALEIAIGSVVENQAGFELNAKHLLLVCARIAHLFGENINNIKKVTEARLHANKELV
jgi:hypothetical protein